MINSYSITMLCWAFFRHWRKRESAGWKQDSIEIDEQWEGWTRYHRVNIIHAEASPEREKSRHLPLACGHGLPRRALRVNPPTRSIWKVKMTTKWCSVTTTKNWVVPRRTYLLKDYAQTPCLFNVLKTYSFTRCSIIYLAQGFTTKRQNGMTLLKRSYTR